MAFTRRRYLRYASGNWRASRASSALSFAIKRMVAKADDSSGELREDGASDLCSDARARPPAALLGFTLLVGGPRAHDAADIGDRHTESAAPDRYSCSPPGAGWRRSPSTRPPSGAQPVSGSSTRSSTYPTSVLRLKFVGNIGRGIRGSPRRSWSR